jgi:VanZ family protein
MRREAQGYHRPALALLGVLLLAVALFGPLPRGRTMDALTDLGHVPLFVGLSAWLMVRRRRAGWSLPAAGAAVWSAAVGLGVAVEVLQSLVGREASVGDVWADAVGALAGILLAAARERAGRVALLIAGAALAALAGTAWPALRLLDVVRQRLHAGRLAGFEDALELDRWDFRECRATRVREHATQGRFALRLALQPGRFPGAGLDSPPPDWSGHSRLAADVYLDGDSPLDLRVKVEDERHDGRLEDRFQRVVRLAPGPSRIEIPLSDVAAGPQGRLLDLRHVAQLRFFAVDLPGPRVLFLDNVALSP